MREIKFRGKRIDNGLWSYGSLYIDERNNYYIQRHDWKREEVIPESVGQFTGLKDKHGKEIYEGDIFEFITMKYPIIVDCRHGYRFMYGKDQICKSEAEYGEIIGNTTDNPELLP